MSLYKNNKVKKQHYLNFNTHLGQWKLEGTTLSNRDFGTLTGNWQIPSVGTPGPITTADGMAYLRTNNKPAVGSSVEEEDVSYRYMGNSLYYDDDQKWERSANDDSGFFSLKNPKSGFFLTMKAANKLTIGNV